MNDVFHRLAQQMNLVPYFHGEPEILPLVQGPAPFMKQNDQSRSLK